MVPSLINIKDYFPILELENPSAKIIAKVGKYYALPGLSYMVLNMSFETHSFNVFRYWAFYESGALKKVDLGLPPNDDALKIRRLIIEEYSKTHRIYLTLKSLIKFISSFTSKIDKSKLKEIISFVRESEGNIKGPNEYYVGDTDSKVIHYSSEKGELYIEARPSVFDTFDIEKIISFNRKYFEKFGEENKSHKIFTLKECKTQILKSYPDMKDETVGKLDDYISTYTDEVEVDIPFVITYMAQHLETTLALCGEVIPLVILLGAKKSFAPSEIKEIKCLIRNGHIPSSQGLLITLIEEKIGPLSESESNPLSLSESE